MSAIDERDRSARYTFEELMDAARELALARIAHMRPAVEACTASWIMRSSFPSRTPSSVGKTPVIRSRKG